MRVAVLVAALMPFSRAVAMTTFAVVNVARIPDVAASVSAIALEKVTGSEVAPAQIVLTGTNFFSNGGNFLCSDKK